MDNYIPPFEISNKMLDLVGSIMEKIGQLSNYSDLNRMPILRRNNRIHSIHSSLSIEANSLSLNQVKAAFRRIDNCESAVVMSESLPDILLRRLDREISE